MPMPMSNLIVSLENASRLLRALSQDQQTGSDLRSAADDTVETIYSFLDKLVLSLPPIKLIEDTTNG
jgi:hypothetical protein